jgi:ribosomal protein S18 acetylase RimI-like enzyme
MKIRKARIGDMQQCLDIQSPETKKKREIFKDNFITEVNDKRFQILVGEIGREVVGFIVYRRDDWNNLFYVEQLFVMHKGKGYGTSLLSDVKKRAIKERIRVIMLDLQPENKSAMRFYKKNGFVKAGHIKGLFDDPKGPNAVILAYKI